MGFLLPLEKTKNNLYHDFDPAYWAIEDLSYNPTVCFFRLCAYPSREARHMNLHILDNPSIGFGSCGDNTVRSQLYNWEVQLAIVDVFPEGIPLDADMQKQIIYEWIKSYTALPFIDVIEEDDVS